MVPASDRKVAPSADAASQYIELLKQCLTDMIYVDDPMSLIVPYRPFGRTERIQHMLLRPVLSVLRALNLHVVRPNRHYAKLSMDQIRECRTKGLDWPPRAHTMIGLKRLDNLQLCIETVLSDEIPGDVLETGVWRGGASIFMKGVLTVHGDRSRAVWLADSFRGLPPPDAERYPADRGWNLQTHSELAVPRERVEANFRAYGLLDERVRFLEGWFEERLPTAPIEKLSVLRLDGDLYKSTIQVLETMYDKLSPGGFLIVDDFGLPPCRMAVEDFRRVNAICDSIVDIDGMAVYWRKSARVASTIRTAATVS